MNLQTDYSTIDVVLAAHGILTITLNRPDKLNALSETVLTELERVLQNAKTNPEVKALLLTGNGKAFCAGADISQLAEANAETGLAFAKRGQAVFNLLEHLGKPSLAAVNGFAFGGGCELAMSATMRIASDNAQFGQPEVKLGVIPGYGGTQRLSRLVGKGRALDLCITGRFIKADVALQWGLVSDVVASGALLETAQNYLNMIIANGPHAVKTAINVIHEGFDLPLAEALTLEATAFAACCETAEKQEGVAAFLEKRKAKF